MTSMDPFESLRLFYFQLNPNLSEEVWKDIAAHHLLKTIAKGKEPTGFGQTTKVLNTHCRTKLATPPKCKLPMLNRAHPSGYLAEEAW